MIRLEEADAVVPNWAEKGKKQKLPNGSLVKFVGKNDLCILVKDPDEKFHCNFTIKPDRYEVHSSGHNDPITWPEKLQVSVML